MTISIESVRATAQTAYPEFRWTISLPLNFDGMNIMATQCYQQKLWFKKPKLRIAYAQHAIVGETWLAVLKGKTHIVAVIIDDVAITLQDELAERKKKRVWK